MYKIENITNKILQGNALDELKKFPDECIDMCVTSPSYFGLRDYGTGKWIGGNENCNHKPNFKVSKSATVGNDIKNIGKKYYKKICKKCGAKRIDEQIGIEKTPEEYVEKLVLIFREIKRILKNHGTLWLNLGDSYYNFKGYSDYQSKQSISNHSGHIMNVSSSKKKFKNSNFKGKDLMEIPSMVAIALRNDGWYLRSRIPWIKRNSMPESVTDRPSSSVEYVFLFSKCEKYYYDIENVRIQQKETSIKISNINPKTEENLRYKTLQGIGRNRRNSDWFFETWQGLLNNLDGDPLAFIINLNPNHENHFASYPITLIEPMILAGTSEKGVCSKCGKPYNRIIEKNRVRRNEFDKNDKRYRPNLYKGKYGNINGKEDAGYTQIKTLEWKSSCNCNNNISPAIVLDCFLGSGTSAIAAKQLGRNFVGIELNSDYIEIAEKRLGLIPKKFM